MSDNQLSVVEQRELKKRESVIENGMKSFLVIGAELREIHEKKLWRGEYKSFIEYVRRRWDFRKSHAYRLLESAAVRTELKNSPIGEKLTTESQYREIAKVPSRDREYVLESAVSRADELNKPLSASLLRKMAIETGKLSQNKKSSPKNGKLKSSSATKSNSGSLTKCLCCGGTGYVHQGKGDQRFQEWWKVILANAPTGSRLKTNRVKAEKEWPSALGKLAASHKDPAGHLRAKVLEYVLSPVGQSKFALNPQRLLNEEFWNEPTETWEVTDDREITAQRNQTYDPSHESAGIFEL